MGLCQARRRLLFDILQWVKRSGPSQAMQGMAACLSYAEGVEGAWISRIHPLPDWPPPKSSNRVSLKRQLK
jgi:hypothetical protein